MPAVCALRYARALRAHDQDANECPGANECAYDINCRGAIIDANWDLRFVNDCDKICKPCPSPAPPVVEEMRQSYWKKLVKPYWDSFFYRLGWNLWQRGRALIMETNKQADVVDGEDDDDHHHLCVFCTHNVSGARPMGGIRFSSFRFVYFFLFIAKLCGFL